MFFKVTPRVIFFIQSFSDPAAVWVLLDFSLQSRSWRTSSCLSPSTYCRNFQPNKIWSYYCSSIKRGCCGDFNPHPPLFKKIEAEDLKGTLSVGCVPRSCKANSPPGERRQRDTSECECARRYRLIAHRQRWTDVNLCISVRALESQRWTDVESDCQRECAAVWSLSGGRGCPSFRTASLIPTSNVFPPL